MQPITEETGRALVAALQDLTTAIKSGTQVPQVGVYDGAYVARSIVGWIEAAKAENKRERRTTRRAKS